MWELGEFLFWQCLLLWLCNPLSLLRRVVQVTEMSLFPELVEKVAYKSGQNKIIILQKNKEKKTKWDWGGSQGDPSHPGGYGAMWKAPWEGRGGLFTAAQSKEATSEIWTKGWKPLLCSNRKQLSVFTELASFWFCSGHMGLQADQQKINWKLYWKRICSNI